jgi:hypothetical protein
LSRQLVVAATGTPRKPSATPSSTVTGVLITGVLVVLVGHTVQTMQAVGWMPVNPVEGLTLPFWAGTWLGVFPTWEGLVLQAAALAFVLGSYVAAEALRTPQAPPDPRGADRARGGRGLSARPPRRGGRAPAR